MYKFNKSLNSGLVFILLFSLLMSVHGFLNPVYAAGEDTEYQRNLTVHIVGGDTFNVKYIDMYYDGASYVSLRDMAAALSGTDAKFDVAVESDGVRLSKGGTYTPVGGEGSRFALLVRDRSAKEYIRARNYFNLDGSTRHYYTFIYMDEETGKYDCYMYLADLVLILGVSMHYEGGELYIDPSSPLSIDPEALEASGYFYATNSVLVGDATNGEVYYSYCPDISVPIASTTKLMAYTIVMDAVTRGELSLEDTVVTSSNVQKLSNSIDRIFLIPEGTSANVSDLIYAMLLPSSNECTLALAEAVAGSEDNFVRLMNRKASDLGLSEGTRFYTCNGLPVYTDEAFESKVQNYMTANDMFKLVCYILSTYPQVTEITSSAAKYLPSFDRTVYNTNPMLRNMPGCIGLKTGTTNKAGCCLVSAVAVTRADGVHTVVSVELGAEDIIMRNNISQTMLTYGEQVCKNGGASSIPDTDPAKENTADDIITCLSEGVPETPDELARLIVWTARNYLPVPAPEDLDSDTDARVSDEETAH